MPWNPTQEQQDAIARFDQNLQIIACAGSGKTGVLSKGIVSLITRQIAEPRQIAAFTFTERAAGELKTRVANEARAALGEMIGMAELYIGTIHGFCLEILQTYAFEFLKYSVLNDIQTKLLINRNSRESGLSNVQIISGPSIGQTLNRSFPNVGIFLDALNVLREEPDASIEIISPSLHEALQSYRALLHRKRALDFSEIQLAAYQKLTGESADEIHFQEQIAARYRHVIVDEYQDINPLQESLIARLSKLGARIVVVGDDDQSIYQWRGTTVSNILTFPARYEDVGQVTLPQNFRSSTAIVSIGDSIAEKNRNERLEKPVESQSHVKYERGDIVATTFRTRTDEAGWIADRIEEMLGSPFNDEAGLPPRGLTYSDFAILTSSVSRTAGSIVDEFRSRNIPFVIAGYANLFATPEVKACTTSFLYVSDDVDEAAVRDAWLNADLGLRADEVDRAIQLLDEAKDWDNAQRWSVYNIQRTYLSLLELFAITEEEVQRRTGLKDRGEVALFNLGKFSQVISDFEQIHFQSAPQQKYQTFSYWLQNEAPGLYEQGDSDKQYGSPNAVVISTIHKAKGMEWPVVFLPNLRRGELPLRAPGGRTKWHILDPASIPNVDRYRGGPSDATRLFYVAVTRTKKWLYASFSEFEGQTRKLPSEYFVDLTRNEFVVTRAPNIPADIKLEPERPSAASEISISFSDLKYFFECAYQFKLRIVYGFNPPLHEALGYGKSLHDALAEVHKRALENDIADAQEAETLVERHLNVPFAYPGLREQLRKSAVDAIGQYLNTRGSALAQTEHSEQVIEVTLGDVVTVSGRIDLVRRLDTGEISIVDFKSTDRAQDEEVTRDQLNTYALGYSELTGRRADMIEVLNLDREARNVREIVDDNLLSSTRNRIRAAGEAIRDSRFDRLPNWCATCARCDLAGICRSDRN